MSEAFQRKWVNLSKLLERPGPLAHPDFEPGPKVKKKTLFFIVESLFTSILEHRLFEKL